MLIMHNCFSQWHEIVVAVVMDLDKMLQKMYRPQGNSKNYSSNLVKLGMWTGCNVLDMHIIFFSLSHENCGCNGSQNVASVGDLCAVGITCTLLHLLLLHIFKGTQE